MQRECMPMDLFFTVQKTKCGYPSTFHQSIFQFFQRQALNDPAKLKSKTNIARKQLFQNKSADSNQCSFYSICIKQSNSATLKIILPNNCIDACIVKQ
jgi:hypothetical protein